jgi:hypothetical protein
VRPVLAALLILAVSRSASGATVITTPVISEHTIWGPGSPTNDTEYVLDPPGSTVVVSGGAVLEVLAGTQIRVAPGKTLVVGAGSPGSLRAVGTRTAPIVFEGVSAQAGSWGGVDFGDGSDDSGAMSRVEHCVFRHGGAGPGASQVRVSSSDGLSLRACTFVDHAGVGLRLDRAAAEVTDCLFANASPVGTYPCSGDLRSIAGLFASNRFVRHAGGAYDAIEITESTLSSSSVLSRPERGFCYVVRAGSTLRVEGADAPVLTIEPRTIVKAGPGTSLRVGLDGVGGIVARRVVFTSVRDDTLGDTAADGRTSGSPGDWGSLVFGPQAMIGHSTLDRCALRYGGGTHGAGIRIDGADPLVTSCTIERNLGHGLEVVPGASRAAFVTGNTLRENTSQELSAPVTALANLVPANGCEASSDGRHDAHRVRKSIVTQSTQLPQPAPGFCYLVAENEFIDVAGPASPTLTLPTRTVMKFERGSFIRMGFGAPGGLVARGVVFTSSRDDTLGDSVGDEIAQGSPGDWGGLRFEAATMDSESVVDGCDIRFAGGTHSNGIGLRDAEPAITNCLVQRNLGNGIAVESDTVRVRRVNGNVLRLNTGAEVAGPPSALEHLVPSNTFVLSNDGRWNAHLITRGDIQASVHIPAPGAGFCYLLATGVNLVAARVNCPTLSIAPGTMVKLGAGGSIQVGGSLWWQGGAFVARGVVFTSFRDDTLGDSAGDGPTSGGPGDWNGIEFADNSSNTSTLEGCTVRFAGRAQHAGVRIVASTPRVERCVIERNRGHGIDVEPGHPGLQAAVGVADNLVRGNAGQPFAAPVSVLASLVARNMVTPNPDGLYNAHLVRPGTFFDSVELPHPGEDMCYLVQTGADIVLGSRLVIAPRTVIKLGSGTSIVVQRSLDAQGVVFTSARDDTLGDSAGDGPTQGVPGDWAGLQILDSSLDNETVLAGCTVRFAGGGATAQIIVQGADPTIRDCLIERGQGGGLFAEGVLSGQRVRGNRIRDNRCIELGAPIGAIASLIAANEVSFPTDGRCAAYTITGGTVTEGVSLPEPGSGVAYRVIGNLAVAPGATLTIPAGTVIKFERGMGLAVAGTLRTEGAVRGPEPRPVVFTSHRDDAWAGDTDGGGPSVAEPHDWGGLEFRPGSEASIVRGAIFRWGPTGPGHVYLNGTGTDSTRVTLRDCHFDVVTDAGGINSWRAVATIDSCSFSGLPQHRAVRNLTPEYRLLATSSWWGSPTGPYDPSMADPCSNPAGLGVGVSDGVDYCPWLADGAPVTDVPSADPPVVVSRVVSLGPNPTRHGVRLVFDLAPDDGFDAEVLDAAGRMTRRLGSVRASGRGVAVEWDGADRGGAPVAPGIYWLRYRLGSEIAVRRVAVLR